jgi:plasmid stabilization system protein ParE
MILRAPGRWPVQDGTHRYVLRRFPYTIAYRVVAGQVVIMAVAHHRREPGSWEGR